MRKEVLIAIIIGFALGLVITFGIWTARKAVREERIGIGEEEAQVTPAAQASPTPLPAFSLAINSPEDESLVNANKVTLNGTTEPGAEVVVIYETGETIITADQSGEFSLEVPLVSGTNEINLSAFSEDQEASKTLYVVYSTAEI